MTGIGIGMAFGAFVAGWVVDNFGAANGFWVSVVASLSAAVVVALGQASLSGARDAVECNALCAVEAAE